MRNHHQDDRASSAIHHLALTVADPARSAVFYDAILALAGYTRHLSHNDLYTWHGASPEILLYRADHAINTEPHDLSRSGFHHVALQVPARRDVDEAYEHAQSVGATILDAPAEYPHYSRGYYAVYVLDPDGLKVEVAHIPVATS